MDSGDTIANWMKSRILDNMAKQYPHLTQQERMSMVLDTAQKARALIEEAEAETGEIDVTSPTASCDDCDPAKKKQSSCQNAQKRVQEEVERIKNSYDHDVEKHGRSMSIFYGFKTPEMVEKYLMPSQYREINKAITQAYGKLVEDAPYLPWARVGHIVTAQFGCRMKDMEWMTGVVPTNVLADEIDNAVRAIGEGNIRIFDGLYPTMRLVADLGPEKFLDCVRNNQFNPPPPKELIKAIEKLQQGEFDEAEEMIIDYEQRKIAPPIYREFKEQYEFMQNWGGQVNMLSFGLFDPQSVLPVTHCTFPPGSSWQDVAPVSMDGSLFNENDRIKFYKKLAPHVYKHYGR